MSRKGRKKPDWSPAEPADPGKSEGGIPAGIPGPPQDVGRWLDDGGRALDADFRAPGQAAPREGTGSSGTGKTARADALGHPQWREWRPAEAPSPNREAPAFPGSGFLDALFLDFPFPAGKREVACHLAEDASLHAGPAETFHDLVVQLDRDGFEDIHELKRALGAVRPGFRPSPGRTP